MPKMIDELKRSHRCGSLRATDVGREVVLMGWVHHRRDHGGCVFIDLRDREGLTQVVFDPAISPEAHALAGELRSEWVLGLVGTVRSRGENVNARLETGAIEVAASRLEVFSRAKTPPFLIEDDIDTSEEVRLKHRFLDLRRPRLQRNLTLRHRFNQITRATLDAEGFLELETPFLIKSTPEGARDYVVPSRVHAGSFFALPQSPQLFKQLFMVSGYDRYFQIVRCFRDEDLRAERQPEFTQVDLEMSFCAPEDVQAVVEKILARVWQELLGVTLPLPLPRMSWEEAMRRFGVDAPDLRFGLELVDLSDLLRGSGFRAFAEAVEKGGLVKAINLHGTGEWSRKDLDELPEVAKTYGAKGLAWIRVKEDGSWQGPIAKFLSAADQQSIAERMKLAVGDIAVFVADRPSVTNATLGNLRKIIAKKRNLIPAGEFRFVWVMDFPLFEWDDQAGRFYAAHHPFTAPQADQIEFLDSDPARVKAQAYDIVLNGVEIGGGSIRIHDQLLQSRLLAALGIGEEEARRKFGFLLEALQYGAPPHGGLALGVDRIMMLLCQTDSIREVIAFPKTQKQTDLMLDAPAPLEPEQLAELSLRTVLAKE